MSMVQSSADPAIVRQLEAMEEQLAATWKSGDCTGWGALLADDWSVTHINGQVITKAQALEMCRTGPAVSSSVDQIAVRVYGDTAIVSGRTKAIAQTTPPQTIVLRFTDVAVRRQGGWVDIASHATQLHETP
jgi:hypothetical protein